jgi:exopolysaccharide biosynthesis polyprenyl glycosylphosphotransferase
MWWRAPWLKRRLLLLGLAVFDAAILFLLYNLAFLRRFEAWAGLTPSLIAVIGLWLTGSYLLGRYSRTGGAQREGTPQRTALASTGLVALMVLGALVIGVYWGLGSRDPRTLRTFLLPPVLAATALSAGVQSWAIQRQRQRRHWLLIGSGEELAVIESELARDGLDQQLQLTMLESTDLHSGIGAIPQHVDGIAVSETANLDDGCLQTLLALRGRGTRVCSLLSWAEQILQRVPPELFTSRWLVQAEGFELQPDRLPWRIKRLGDLAVAGLLLALTAPLVGLAALLIRLEDGGPVFYAQWRTGMYGEPIRIRKLRSMRTDAEVRGARWAQLGDPRITRIGRVLRQLRIDELPQLLSVLRGEMSLIGPRPERPELEQSLETGIPHYRVRHWVRPGLSGWAQVCYPYGASLADSRNKLSYDLYYLRNASLALDVLILLKTIRLVARGAGSEPLVLSA